MIDLEKHAERLERVMAVLEVDALDHRLMIRADQLDAIEDVAAQMATMVFSINPQRMEQWFAIIRESVKLANHVGFVQEVTQQ